MKESISGASEVFISLDLKMEEPEYKEIPVVSDACLSEGGGYIPQRETLVPQNYSHVFAAAQTDHPVNGQALFALRGVICCLEGLNTAAQSELDLRPTSVSSR